MLKLSTFIFISFAISTTLAIISPHCLSQHEFDLVNTQQLGGKSLEKIFEDSQDVLGQGAFGVVKAIDWVHSDGSVRKVAVKRATPKGEDLIKMVSDEINVMEKFKDKEHIMSFLGCQATISVEKAKVAIPGTAFVVLMDVPVAVFYIVSDKLYADLSIKGKGREFAKLPVVNRLEGYLSFAKGLKELHEGKYIHSDIKPANIMAVDSSLTNIKLIDLGMVAEFNKRTFGGTPGYIPPQHYTHSPADPSFDIYSFGVSVATLELGEAYVYFYVEKYHSHEKFPPLVQKAIKQFLPKDKNLGYSTTEENLVSIVFSCIEDEAWKRPSADQLISRLEEAIKVVKTKAKPNANPSNKNAIFPDNKAKLDDGLSEDSGDSKFQFNLIRILLLAVIIVPIAVCLVMPKQPQNRPSL
jgi:serine/threonine protein kinase